MKKVITSKSAPAAIGPYSQAISVEGGARTIYFSGAIALDPATGQLVGGGIEPETKQVMINIEGLLKEVGATFDNVVKSTIFLTNMADFAVVNQIYGGYFRKDPPARSTVAVSQLPRNAKVEIEVTVAL
ncbi:MAG: Rid family detoxifying hydrolase [Bdellovibrionota bacterium]